MSRIIAIILITLSILCLSLCGIYYVSETKRNFDQLITTGLEQCSNQDEAGLQKTAKKMSAFFKSRHGFLSFFVRHDEIEKIDTDLVNLLGYTQNKSYDNAKICLNHIKFMANHIYQNEIPNMENLF